MSDAVEALRAGMDRTVARLAALVEVPGISAKAFPPKEVRRSAEATAETLGECGMEGVRLLETAGHPAVYAELRTDPEAATVLVYGHHDVQPPGRMKQWLSPPFVADVREGRMFGRGTADDKGGFLAYVAAAEACANAGAVPCNLKLLIEGEEEIGSPNLAAVVAEHRELLGCDFIVLCDTPNFARGVPAITYRLRGNCIVDVEVRCLERPLHSGQAGGLAPDAIMILCTILGRLQRDDGTLAIPGLEERVAIDEGQVAALRALRFDGDRVRQDFGFLDGVSLLADSWEAVWMRPSLAVTAIEAVPVAQAANQIADVARARLSLRTVRGLDSLEAGELLAAALQSNVPHGAHVTVQVAGGPSWWEADPRHPVFDVARRALGRGFGREAVMIGSGGSIGFVKPFAELAGEVPPILTGVQDPASNAHSENESLGLADWERAMAGAVYLFEDLAQFAKGAAA
ncbi:MAG TPA: M20/M25/M40 family metallo-hydrolase [Thermoanaerobaculia bacterium]|jgi:acetylornithine deacetylase/succinyl-diaminopimelate desuccinylase-like protein|nr:M20/M25/M40 family metallo-hydrolase [Thermoanaerobaculia bacterium]